MWSSWSRRHGIVHFKYCILCKYIYMQSKHNFLINMCTPEVVLVVIQIDPGICIHLDPSYEWCCS